MPENVEEAMKTATERMPTKVAKIMVAVRVRPPTDLEKEKGDVHTCVLPTGPNSLQITNPTDSKKTTFAFDHVFDQGQSQVQVYQRTIQDLLNKIMEGYNGCIFAYGQTSSGKSYTMLGKESGTDKSPVYVQPTTEGAERDSPITALVPEAGIIPRVGFQIFQFIHRICSENPSVFYRIRASYLEIYNETLSDLLNPKASSSEIKIRLENSDRNADQAGPNPVYVMGLTEKTIQRPEDIMSVISMGQKVRRTAATNMNEYSSRSHAVLTLHIEELRRTNEREVIPGIPGPSLVTGLALSPSTPVIISESAMAGRSLRSLNSAASGSTTPVLLPATPELGSRASSAVRASSPYLVPESAAVQTRGPPSTRDEFVVIKRSKLHLIDLAGSERQESTGATGDLLKEGSNINLSLLYLGQVIKALSSKSGFAPYRNSKLTQLLSDSLGGNSLTLMITCVSPVIPNFQESLSALQFTERAKLVKNHAKINFSPQLAKIIELETRIRELEKALEECKKSSRRLSETAEVSVQFDTEPLPPPIVTPKPTSTTGTATDSAAFEDELRKKIAREQEEERKKRFVTSGTSMEHANDAEIRSRARAWEVMEQRKKLNWFQQFLESLKRAVKRETKVQPKTVKALPGVPAKSSKSA